jgi:hypothetical protein
VSHADGIALLSVFKEISMLINIGMFLVEYGDDPICGKPKFVERLSN